MSLAVFFPVRKNPPTIGALQLDASLSEDHKYDNLVTEFPVETGETITDHIVNRPIHLSITGFITNAPIKEYTNVRRDASYESEDSAPVHTAVAYDALIDIWKKRQPVEIVTPLSKYSNMALTSLTIPRNPQVGDTLQFSAEFVQISFADSLDVPVESLDTSTSGAKGGTKEQASNTVDNSNQTVKEVPAESRLHAMFGE